MAAQQTGLDVVGRESDMGQAAQSIEHLQPDVILLDVSDQSRDPATALMRFFRNALDTKVIGVNLADDCITIHYERHRVTQGVGDLLRVIREAANAGCSECRAEGVNREEKQNEWWYGT